MFESIGSGREEKGSGLAPWATIFAVTLGVSFGLCGLTAIASGVFRAGESLVMFGILELAGMAVGVGGLLVIAFIAVARAVAGSFNRSRKEDE